MEPSKEDLAEYLKIRRMVHRCLARSFDQDNLAAEIWLDVWSRSKEKGERIHVTWLHIRRRCIDEVRRVARKKEVPVIEALDVPETSLSEDYTDVEELINLIMQCPTLSHAQRMLIYDKYYRGLSNGELAQARTMSQTRLKESVSTVIRALQSWVVSLGLEIDALETLGLKGSPR